MRNRSVAQIFSEYFFRALKTGAKTLPPAVSREKAAVLADQRRPLGKKVNGLFLVFA